MPGNLLAFHLRVLDDAGIVRRVKSEGDGRRQYVQLRLDDPTVAALTRPVPTDALTASLAQAAGPDPAARLRLHRQLRPLPARRRRLAPGQPDPRYVGRHPPRRAGAPRAVAAGRRHGLDLTTAATADLVDVHVAATATLLVAVCDNAHEELTRTGLSDTDRDDSTRQPALAALARARPRPRRHAEAFETAYDQITERVDRLAAALDELPRAS